MVVSVIVTAGRSAHRAAAQPGPEAGDEMISTLCEVVKSRTPGGYK
jgi:hypothetical protein